MTKKQPLNSKRWSPQLRAMMFASAALLWACGKDEPAPPPPDSLVKTVSAVPALNSRMSARVALKPSADHYVRVASPVSAGVKHHTKMLVSIPKSSQGAVRLEGNHGSWMTIAVPGRTAVNGQLVDNGVVYAGVATDTDVVNVATATSFEEIRVLKSPTAPSEARYRLAMSPGMVARERYGSIQILDAERRVAFETAPAVAVDAKGQRRGVELALETNANDTWVVASVDTSGLTYPIYVDPEWVAGDWPSESIVGMNSVLVDFEGTGVGDIAVIGKCEGKCLKDDGVELFVEGKAFIDGDVRADSITLKADTKVLGNAAYNERDGNGAVKGTETTTLALPLPIEVPAFPTFSSGPDLLEIKNEHVTLPPGSYGKIKVKKGPAPGDSEAPTLLTLSGGIYNFKKLKIAEYARVECAAPCEIRIHLSLNLEKFTYLGPQPGIGLGPNSVEVFVEQGRDDDPWASPAVILEEESEFTGRLFVPDGTIFSKKNAVHKGIFVARDVVVGAAAPQLCTADTDLICDGLDEDCDGVIDDDYPGDATTCGVGACAATGNKTCTYATEGDTCTPGTPAANDATCDGIDDDCDGQIDEDYAPAATSCGVGACAASGATSCVAGVVQDSCAAGTPAADDTVCDGIDNDCNGETDEDYVVLNTSCGVGACSATGATSCTAGSVADSCAAGTPAADDTLCDGIDNDCNGQTDEGYVSLNTSCGVGACGATGATSCPSGSVVDSCTVGTPAANDTLCDGIDNDCRGETDEDYV